MIYRNLFHGILLLIAIPAVSSAQTSGDLVPGDSTLVEGIAAVVGDSVILRSEVQQQILFLRAQNQPASREAVLEELINIQLVLQAAGRDSTLVPDEVQIEERVDAQVASAQEQFPTPEAFQQALRSQGLTLARYRTEIQRQARNELVQQMFLQRQLQNAPQIAVSEDEMRTLFEENRGSLGLRPELVTIEQVLLPAGASEVAWERAEAKVDSLRALAVSGEVEFDSLATLHSEDPGSAAQGGLLGWVRRGETVAEFERTAFALPDGQVSLPVRTDFGMHILKVERSRPGERRVRHILVRPELTETDFAASRERADRIADRMRAGEDPAALADEFGDPELPAEFTVPRAEPGQLPPGFIENIAGVQAGDVVGPFQTEIGGAPYFAVLHVSEVRPEGPYTFEDLRDQIRETLARQKCLERVYERLRDDTFVEVRG